MTSPANPWANISNPTCNPTPIGKMSRTFTSLKAQTLLFLFSQVSIADRCLLLQSPLFSCSWVWGFIWTFGAIKPLNSDYATVRKWEFTYWSAPNLEIRPTLSHFTLGTSNVDQSTSYWRLDASRNSFTMSQQQQQQKRNYPCPHTEILQLLHSLHFLPTEWGLLVRAAVPIHKSPPCVK